MSPSAETYSSNRNVFLATLIGVSESKIQIGDCCLFSPNVVIITGEHAIKDCSVPARLKDSIPGQVLIGDDYWIG